MPLLPTHDARRPARNPPTLSCLLSKIKINKECETRFKYRTVPYRTGKSPWSSQCLRTVVNVRNDGHVSDALAPTECKRFYRRTLRSLLLQRRAERSVEGWRTERIFTTGGPEARKRQRWCDRPLSGAKTGTSCDNGGISTP
jgi:hypothetical protein